MGRLKGRADGKLQRAGGQVLLGECRPESVLREDVYRALPGRLAEADAVTEVEVEMAEGDAVSDLQGQGIVLHVVLESVEGRVEAFVGRERKVHFPDLVPEVEVEAGEVDFRPAATRGC